MASDEGEAIERPPVINYILGFVLVGIAWGLTTPFIRHAAKTHRRSKHAVLLSEAVRNSWVRRKVYAAFFAAADLLRNPRYAVPLLLNLTGSVWFFLLIGQAGECFPLLNQFFVFVVLQFILLALERVESEVAWQLQV